MSKLSGYIYDIVMKPFERTKLEHIRSELLAEARGEILEIGSGTGINFPYYRAGRVTALEPNDSMRHRSMVKAKESKVPVKIIKGDARRLEFEDDAFDTVVSTLVFCSIPEPRQAVAEIRRVCKPGGRILLFEHVRLDKGLIAKVQDTLNPIWRSVSGGCNLNRDTVRLLREEGLEIKEVKKYFQDIFITIRATNQDKRLCI